MKLPLEKLTRKELHLWTQVCLGVTLKCYAKQTNLSYGYVRNKFGYTIKKLELRNREWQKYVDYRKDEEHVT
jgi:hypothetical protein